MRGFTCRQLPAMSLEQYRGASGREAGQMAMLALHEHLLQ